MEESTIELGHAILLRHRAMYQVQMEMAERAWGSATYAATLEFVNALQRRWHPVADGSAEDSMVPRASEADRRPRAPRIVEGQPTLPASPTGHLHPESEVAAAANPLPSTGVASASAAAQVQAVDVAHPMPVGPDGAAEHRAAGSHPELEARSADGQEPHRAAQPQAVAPFAPAAPASASRAQSVEEPHASFEDLLARPWHPAQVPVATAAPAVGDHPPGSPSVSPGAAPSPSPVPAAIPQSGEWTADIPGRGNAPLTWADRVNLLKAGLAPRPAPAPSAAVAPTVHGAQTPAPEPHAAEPGAHPQPAPAAAAPQAQPASAAGTAPSPIAAAPHAPPAATAGAAHAPPVEAPVASTGTWTNAIGEGGSRPLTWRDRGRLIAEAFARDTRSGTHELPAAVRPGQSGPGEHLQAGAAASDPLPGVPAPPVHPAGASPASAPLQHTAPLAPEHAPAPATPSATGGEHTSPGTAAVTVVASQPVDPNRPWHGPGSMEYAAAHPPPGGTAARAVATTPSGASGAASAQPAAPALASVTTSTAPPPGPSLVHRDTPASAATASGPAAPSPGAIAAPAAPAEHTAAPAAAAAPAQGPGRSSALPHDQHAFSDEVSAQMLRRFAREMALEAERRGVVAWDY